MAPAGLASSAYSATHLYDSLGRPSQTTQTIDGTNYVTQGTYDGAGRPLRTVYPASVWGAISTRNVYNAYGYLQEIRNWVDSDTASGELDRTIASPTGRLYWQADSYSVTGKINGEVYGNGLANDRAYSSVTGRLYRATIDRGSVVTEPFFVQDLNYSYDAMGNVKSRVEATTNFGRDERFSYSNGADGYDGLDRLKVHRIVGGATVTLDYDTNGNITNKSDVGAYTYTGYGPHAVSTAGANSYTYDGVGNMTGGAGRSLEWTSFNQMKKVTQGTKSSEFAFGAGHERVLQIRRTSGTVTDRTVYVGGLYERVLLAGGLIEHKHYIMGPTGRIAIHTERSDLSKDTRWFHTDGLGSITVISDEAGRVLKRYTYDAWGKQSTAYTTSTSTTNLNPSTRGFTDHEMLSDYGLIHMNGRVYDPVLGRFLSADPNVDGVADAQGFNRYSYVGNNPMNATDPTGYFSLKELLPAIIAIVVTAVVIVAIVASGGTAITGLGSFFSALQTGLGTTAAIWGGAAGGFAGGFSGSLLNGGSIGDAFKAGVIGAAVGAATAWASGQIGGFFGADNGTISQWGGRTLAHATVGGLASEAQGGSFRHGFYASAASVGFMHSSAGRSLMGSAHMAVRTVTAAVIGGTASVLSGGKFANGAVTSAFQHLFNQESDHIRDTAEKTALDGPKEKIMRVVMLPDEEFRSEYPIWSNDSGMLAKEVPFKDAITIIDHYATYEELKQRVALYREMTPGTTKLIIMGHGNSGSMEFGGVWKSENAVYSDLAGQGWSKGQTTLGHCGGPMGMFANSSHKVANRFRESIGSRWRWVEMPNGDFTLRSLKSMNK